MAYHYSQGEGWARALEYLVQAGDKAVAAYANQDALDFYAQALTVCEKLGDAALPTAIAMSQKRGDVHMFIQHPQDAIGDFDRMAAAARRLGGRHLEGLALASRGSAEEEHHEFERAEETLRAALAVGEEGDDDVRQLATWRLAHTITMIGRKAEAEALLREAEARARQRGDRSLQEAFEEMLALFYIWDGRFDAALALGERFDATHGADSPVALVGSQWAKALALGGKGEYTQALALLHDIVATCDRIGEVWTWRRALNTLGWLYGELQDHERALEWNTRGVQAVWERGAPETTTENENNARLNLGDTLLALGRLEEAEAQFRAVE